MNREGQSKDRVAIACGGTGGHLFPGLAVAEQFLRRGFAATLLISPKDVDQEAVRSLKGIEVERLPAVGWQRGRAPAFFLGFARSYLAARKIFRAAPPKFALAMGGFTSAPPLLAARAAGAGIFLHESNTIPGRANRWLARRVDRAFVGFPCAVARLRAREVIVTGTPVRSSIHSADAHAARAALGLEPARPVLLVMGGSQGASAINDMLIAALPLLAAAIPELQYFHLSGPGDVQKVKQAYLARGLHAVVHPFFAAMDLALASATAALSRAGASSLAEFAALQLPAILVPYPFAADDHQRHNAKAFVETSAACLLEQSGATPETLACFVKDLVTDPASRARVRNGLCQWQSPNAGQLIADYIINSALPSPSPASLQIPSRPVSSLQASKVTLAATATQPQPLYEPASRA